MQTVQYKHRLGAKCKIVVCKNTRQTPLHFFFRADNLVGNSLETSLPGESIWLFL